MKKIIVSLILAFIFIAKINASQYNKEFFAKVIAAELQKQQKPEELKKLELLTTTVQSCREVVPFFHEQFIDCIAYPEDTCCTKEQIRFDRFTRACTKAEVIRKKHLQDWLNYLQNKTS